MRPFFVRSRGSHPISNNMWVVLFSEGVLVTPTKIRTRSLSYDNYRVFFFGEEGGGGRGGVGGVGIPKSSCYGLVVA